jgi:maltooligosyltrehalose trehalohydrolase
MRPTFPESTLDVQLKAAGWRPSLGAWPVANGVRFRVWAPDHPRVEVVFEDAGRTRSVPLERLDDGSFSGLIDQAGPGARYRYRLSGDRVLPDPASRFQPEGVHGPSEVVDPFAFQWTDESWTGVALADLIIYELHVGAFSDPGTFAGVESRLDYLAHLGVTAIELMPIAEFAGRWNWGYDGVDLFAPSHNYGRPEHLQRLVNAAHHQGLGVILDVVYNHLGPDGAYLSAFAPHYFDERHHTPWGAAINLDGADNARVREFLLENALHWIHEYHIDGLRLDATHELIDDTERPFLGELAETVRAAGPRHVVVTAEDDRNLARLALPAHAGGFGLDALWADDFHHHMRRRLAGDREGYFESYQGRAADIALTLQSGWFFSGQVAPHTGRYRGTNPVPLDLEQFIICLQNHDQVGNRAHGDRLNHGIDAASYRAATALLLCAPETPLIFMGQEWGASTPFRFFTDHTDDIGTHITNGRREEFAAFTAFRDPDVRRGIPDPQDPQAFADSRLNWNELTADDHQRTLRLYRALLAFRRTNAAMLSCERATVTTAALDGETVALWRHPADAPAVALVARLSSTPGSVRVPGYWRTVLTTEDQSFAADGRLPVIQSDDGGVVIRFARAGAVLFRSAGRQPLMDPEAS